MSDVTIKVSGGCTLHLSGGNAEEALEFCRRFVDDDDLQDAQADITIQPRTGALVGTPTAGDAKPQTPQWKLIWRSYED